MGIINISGEDFQVVDELEINDYAYLIVSPIDAPEEAYAYCADVGSDEYILVDDDDELDMLENAMKVVNYYN